MKLTNDNENYSAVVVKIGNLLDLENADRLVGISHFGMQAVVSRGTYEVGDVGILFPTECQLALDLAAYNDLHAHSELNRNKEAKGYLGDNARVRAIKLRGHVSNALFLPLSCLSYLDVNVNDLKVGDSFTHINGNLVVSKYIKQVLSPKGDSNKTKGQAKVQKVDPKLLPEHHETPQLLRNLQAWKPDDYCFVSAKLHGSSVRLANVLVPKSLPWFARFAKWCGVQIIESEYKCVAGSRKVVKYRDASQSYYKADIYNEALEKVKHVIPKNWILYGELVGWAGDSPIQKNYSYCIPKGEHRLYVYRISTVNQDGMRLDLHWDQVKEFCLQNGINHVPEMERGLFEDIDVDYYMDKSFFKSGFKDCLPLDEGAPCDEGVVLMKYGVNEYFAKAKSPNFYLHETKQLDSGEIDMESQES